MKSTWENDWLRFGIVSACLLLFHGRILGQAISYERYVLPNGLTVLLHEDHTLPLVAVNILYKVGSKDERPGKTGFAHVFEHYMFEGSQHVPNGEIDDHIDAAGGMLNATTNEDRTDYFDAVPSRYLEEVLRIEADRMCCLDAVINEKSLDKQREIVKNEKRRRENKAYGQLDEVLNGHLWPEGHPYHHTVIGSMDDLNAAGVDDVKDFHSNYYRPNNAVMVIAGDIDPSAVKAMVSKWFSGVPAGPDLPALQLPRVADPGGPRSIVIQDPKAQMTLVVMAYPIPGKGQPGWLELSALAEILGGGRSARLVQALQKQNQLVVSINVGVYGQHLADTFEIKAVAAPGATPARVKEAVAAELDRLRRDGIFRDELDRVKARIRTARLNNLQNIEEVAGSMAEGEGLEKDPNAGLAELEKFQQMTLDAPRQAAERYLQPGNSLSIVIEPQTGGKP